MAKVTLKGNSIHTVGELPKVGSPGSNFRLTRGDLSDISLADFEGKVKILNIVLTLDTGVGAASARRFEKEAGDLGNVVVLTISRHLPFAQKRCCTAKNISKVVTLSELRHREFGQACGVALAEGPMAGLLLLIMVVVDANDEVVYAPVIVQGAD